MHEVTVAQSAVTIALEESEKQDAKKIALIELEIGDLSLISVVQLEFWIKEFLKGTIGEGCEVLFSREPGVIKCNDCGKESNVEIEDDPSYHFTVPRFDCTNCGSYNTFILKGREMTIKRIRVER